MIRTEALGELRLVLIDRPAKRNALTRAMIGELTSAIEAAAAGEQPRGLVIAGAGPSFCAGVDLDEFEKGTAESGRGLILALKELCAAVRRCPKPVACAIQGHCLGGALELAAAADLRLADPQAWLGMPEVGMGLPSVIDAALLERHLGLARARELILTGDPMSGQTAYEWGFVNALAPAHELVEAAAVLLARVTRHPGPAIAAQKKLFAQWLNLPLDEAVEASVEPLVEAFRLGLPQAAARRLRERWR